MRNFSSSIDAIGASEKQFLQKKKGSVAQEEYSGGDQNKELHFQVMDRSSDRQMVFYLKGDLNCRQVKFPGPIIAIIVDIQMFCYLNVGYSDSHCTSFFPIGHSKVTYLMSLDLNFLTNT